MAVNEVLWGICMIVYSGGRIDSCDSARLIFISAYVIMQNNRARYYSLL